jgi:RND superfamily putative drug exporter
MLARLASFCYRRRWLVLALWLVVLIAVNMFAGRAGDGFSQQFSLNGSDSQQATDLLARTKNNQGLLTGEVVYKADQGVTDPAVQARLNTLFDQIKAVAPVSGVISPYDTSPQAKAQVAPGGHIAYATVQFPDGTTTIPDATTKTITDQINQLQGNGLQLELGGSAFQGRKPPGGTEAIGLIAAVIILLLAFGSVLAMGLPIITALFGIGVGIALVSLVSHLTSVPQFATTLAAMIGLGVGIDYALFIVTRYRQGLSDGLDPHQAVVTAINTAGRAVLFAGTTVVISLGGMLLMGITFVSGLGIGAAAVVAVTMVASLTLLPAILGFVGRNVDKLSIPGIGKNAHGGRQGFWFRWSRTVQRHPWPGVVVGLVVLLALSVPVLSLRLGSSDASSLPTSSTTRRAYDLKAEGFGPGASSPFVLVAELPAGAGPEVLVPIHDAVAKAPGVAFVSPPPPVAQNGVSTMLVIPTTSQQEAATLDTMNNLRDNVLPQATNGTGIQVHVGGVTALFEDLAAKLQQRLPLFIGVVLGLSFLLLMVVFRSVVVPAKAVIMNLLSIGAAYGILVAVFEWGWGKDLIGIGNTGPVESFLPMMMFAILFGLSMDYEVFLLSRIKEEYDRTGSNHEAVADGLSATARVITAAAAIMICVFGSFALGDERVIKEFGLGLAVAVLIDATVVRMILVPSTMELLGDANWWLPKWLQWLPQVHIDGNDVPTPDLDAELAELTSDETSGVR